MKKVVSVLLVITMFFTLACGCNKDDDPTIDSKSSDTKQGRLLKKYVDINKSGKYMLETDLQVGENSLPVSIAFCNKDKKMFTITQKINETQDLTINIVINGDKKMLIISNAKIYGYLDDNQMKSITDMLQSYYIELSKLSFDKSGKTKINGKEYKYEDYKNLQSHGEVRYVFDDKKLVMQSKLENGEAKEYIKMSISGDVTPEMFEAPEDFKEDKKSIDKIANMFDEKLKENNDK